MNQLKIIFIRYEELHMRIQASFDAVSSDDRESLRYIEEKSHIKKFIRSLRSEIEIRLLTNQPRTLREAFFEAQLIDKQLKDNESLRRQ